MKTIKPTAAVKTPTMIDHSSETVPNTADWLTADQLARALQVTVRTIRRWTKDGAIPFKRIGVGRGSIRFPRAILERSLPS